MCCWTPQTHSGLYGSLTDVSSFVLTSLGGCWRVQIASLLIQSRTKQRMHMNNRPPPTLHRPVMQIYGFMKHHHMAQGNPCKAASASVNNGTAASVRGQIILRNVVDVMYMLCMEVFMACSHKKKRHHKECETSLSLISSPLLSSLWRSQSGQI